MAEEIRVTFNTLGLDLVQLHGDEPPELLRELRGIPVMRAFRVEGDLSAIPAYLHTCHRLMCQPRMLMLDARRPGQYGGTGATLDWPALAAHRPQLCGLPLVLAGGLRPDNVAGAIAAVRPWAVDTASGVEASPGKKSQPLVCEFLAAAKAALARSAVAK
jgi:phosphoribosylanthranilate isomerase